MPKPFREKVRDNVRKHGLKEGLHKSFGQHSCLKTGQFVEALDGMHNEKTIQNSLGKLHASGELVRLEKGRYVLPTHKWLKAHPELPELRNKFASLATQLEPEGHELNKFVLFVHDEMKEGTTTCLIKQYLQKNMKRHVEKKYGSLDHKLFTTNISKFLNSLAVKGEIFAVEGVNANAYTYAYKLKHAKEKAKLERSLKPKKKKQYTLKGSRLPRGLTKLLEYEEIEPHDFVAEARKASEMGFDDFGEFMDEVSRRTGVWDSNLLYTALERCGHTEKKKKRD